MANDAHDVESKPPNRILRAAKAREGSVKCLNTAKSDKNDEFHTILSDIERELHAVARGREDRVRSANRIFNSVI
jgi:hypothetical protein